MSYILSALRRAEAQRRDGAAGQGIATFTADDVAPVAAPRRHRGIVVGLVSAAALVAGAGYFASGFFSPAAMPALENPVAQPRPHHPAPEPSPAAAAQRSSASAPATTNSSPPAPAVSAAPPAPVEAPEQKSWAVDQAPPRLNITGYIFFENDPQNSKLFVDGVVYRLHSRLAGGAVVEAFLDDQVVVSHHGVEHRIPVR